MSAEFFNVDPIVGLQFFISTNCVRGTLDNKSHLREDLIDRSACQAILTHTSQDDG